MNNPQIISKTILFHGMSEEELEAALLKHKARLEEARQIMEEAQDRMEESQAIEQEAQVQVHQLLTWADRYDKASIEEKHMIISHLVERIDIGEKYQINIKFRIATESLLAKTA